MLSSRATAVYALEFGKDSATLAAAIVARSEDGWRGFYGATGPLPPKPRGSFDTGGATVDTLWLLIDTENRIAWIHSERVSFRTDNVMLVDRVDGIGGPPKDVGTLLVPHAFAYQYECSGRISRSPADSVRAMLLRDSRIREFVRP